MLFTSLGPGSSRSMATSMLRLDLGLSAEVRVSGESRREIVHVLTCCSDAPAIADTFGVLCEAFLITSAQRDPNRLITLFSTLARLFAVSPEVNPKSEQQGLWGELLFMFWTGRPRSWMAFWHSDPALLHDFAVGNLRLEVKTGSGESRNHTFSHRQLFCEEKDVVVCSLLVRADDTGVALRDLVDRMRGHVRHDFVLLTKLETAVRRAGLSDPNVSGPRFDEVEAKNALIFVRSNHIPRFPMPEPPGVTSTIYRAAVDLSPSLGPDELAAWLELWTIPEAYHA